MGKKPKSKSKGKDTENQKLNEMIEMPIENKCGVCRQALKPDHIMMTCQYCKISTHSACYNGDYQNTKKHFVCDLCKAKKKIEHCVICRQHDVGDMFKALERTNAFAHVQCALLSNLVQVESYSKLGLINKGDIDKISKQTINCLACGETGFGNVIQCVVCPKKGHFRCWIKVFGETNNFYMISRWLDKCERYDFLLNWILSKKKTNLKGFMEPSVKIKEGQLAVCQDHSENYSFCYCENEELSKHRVHSDYQCDDCQRWIHQPCSGLPPKVPEDQKFTCEGCKKNNKFKRELKLHQLLSEVSKVEKEDKLGEESIRLLNCFPFKYSGLLEKKIMDNLRQIEIYFAKKQVVKLITSEDQDQKKKKKIIDLLMIIIYGDKWKQRGSEVQKVQTQYSKFLSSILNIFSKEIQQKINKLLKPNTPKDSKEIDLFKQELKNFIKQWKIQQHVKGKDGYLQLAYGLKELQIKFNEAFKNSQEQQKEFFNKFNILMGNQFFGIILRQKFISKELITQALKRYSLIRYYKQKFIQISQGQYINIIDDSNLKIKEIQMKQWNQLMSKLKKDIDSLPITYQSLKKEQKYKKYQSQLKQNQDNARFIKKISNQMLKNQVCILNCQTFALSRLKQIEQNSLKKKVLKICIKKDYTITQDNFTDIIRIEKFLRKKINLFTQNQLLQIKKYTGKLQFLEQIFKKGQSLQQYLICDEPPVENGTYSQKTGVMFIKFFHILENWDEKILPSDFFISQFYNKCVLKMVKFDNSLVERKIKNFVTFLSNRYMNGMEEGRRMNFRSLQNLVKVLEHFELQNQFPYFIDLYQKVKKWMNLFQNEEKPESIPLLLEKPQKANNLIKVLDHRIGSGFDLQKVSLGQQINKLCLLRQWCRLTEKICLLFKSKATINSIQTLNSLLISTQYPTNSLKKKVSELEVESKNLNRQVNKFLQKPRVSQHMGFYQQLKFISSKMTLEEGQTIKAIFEKSNLDVYVESQELENQIKQFQLLPSALGQFSEKHSLNQLHFLRRKLMESCFKPAKLEQYEKILRKIYVLRCQYYEPPITREQYFQLLTVGGVAAIEFQNKTSQLLKAYRLIQKAQIELSNQGRKRNFSSLIPWSEHKYRELREILKQDPMQLSKFEKARLINLKNRQQYYHLRTRRVEIQRYREIEHDLNNSIFNNKDIINEISSLKSQLDRLVRRVEDVLPYSHPYPQMMGSQNIFKRDRAILDTYSNLKIKHPVLDKFEHDCRCYNRAEHIRQEISVETYRLYCENCGRVSDLGCRIPQFIATRTRVFLQMYQTIMESPKPSVLDCQTLITEGLELRRLQSNQKEQIFDYVIHIYSHLRQRTKDRNEDENDADDLEQDDDGHDSSSDDDDDNEDDDEDLSNDPEDDDDDDDDISPEAKDNNQIVLDSD